MEIITTTLQSLDQIPSILFSPESTHDTLIFPYSFGSQTFIRIRKDQCKESDINDILAIFEIVLSRVDSSRKFFLNLFFPIFIPSLLLMSEFGRDYWLGDNLKFLHMIFISIIVIFALSQRRIQMEKIKPDVQRTLEIIRPTFAKRGLAWHFSEGLLCSWLELQKEQEGSLIVEVHSGHNQEESSISHCRIREEFTDGKNDLPPPYLSDFILYFCIMLCVITAM